MRQRNSCGGRGGGGARVGRFIKRSTLFLLLAGAGGAVAGGAGAEAEPWIVACDWGPVASRLVDADGHVRVRAVGPFWERAKSTNGLMLVAGPRPLWARAADANAGRAAWDFVWPVAAGKSAGAEDSWRWGVAYFFDRDREDAASQYRFWLLPVWWHGRDEQSVPYMALFPVGGEVRNFLGRDSIRFALFPLWMQGRVKLAQTTSVLWPIYSHLKTEDGRVEARRVFPLYGHSRVEGKYDNYAALWPFWTHARYFYPQSQGTAWVLWPLAGRVDMDTQQGWMALPPLFQHVRSEQMTRIYAPWPFVQWQRGTIDKTYVWPLYGRRRDESLESRFWLWPLVRSERDVAGRQQVRRWVVAPVYRNVTVTEAPEAAQRAPGRTSSWGTLGLLAARAAARQEAAGAGEASVPAPAPAPAAAAAEPGRVLASRVALWPLFSKQMDAEQQTYRLRMLHLWPGAETPPVERSWAPLWTLADYRVSGTNSDLDVLWGLYRHTRRGEDARAFSLFPVWQHERAGGDAARRWSVLKGLLAYDRTATNRQVRFLWLGRWRLKTPAPEALDVLEEP